MIKDTGREDGTELREAGWGEALDRVAGALSAAPPQRVAVLGGARLTNEAQYMWAKLAKGVIGTDNVDAQLGDGLDPALVFGLPRATIDEACRPGGTVLLLGPDPKEELGTLYLRLRHAIVNDGVTLIEVTPSATGLSHLAAHSLRPSPGDVAALVRGLVSATGLTDAENAEDTSTAETGSIVDQIDDARITAEREEAAPRARVAAGVDRVGRAAKTLADAAGGVTVILGRASLAESADAVAEAAMELAKLPSARFVSALRRGNVHGALEAGLAPGLLPGRVRVEDPTAASAEALAEAWPTRPASEGFDARGILQAAADGEIDVLVLVGADPLNDFIDRDLARRGLLGAGSVVAVDLFVNDSAALAADVILAAAGPTECDGTFTNLEGRVSQTSRKVTPPGTARPDWMIAAELAERLEPGSGLDSPESIRAEMARVSELHRPVTEQALAANPTEGVLLAAAPANSPAGGWRPGRAVGGGRQSTDQMDSGTDPAGGDEQADSRERLRLVASRTMYDDGVMLRHCPSSRGLAPGAYARANPCELDRIGLADGTKVRVSSSRGDIEAVLIVDRGVPEGSLAVNWLAPDAPANALISADDDITVVTVEAR